MLPSALPATYSAYEERLLHGYDSDNQLRASYRFDKLKNEAGREVVRITRDDGPSVESFDVSLSKDDPRYWTKNITDTAEFGAPLKLAVDDLQKALQGTSLTSGGGTALTTGTRSLHTLAPGGGGLTNPSETHLICTNNDGDSCELASAGWVVLDCGGTAVGTLVTALGIASCPLVFGCVVAAGGAAATVAGAAACGKDIGQRTEGDPSYCKCDQK